MSVLLTATGRRGLGHLVRGLNIARAMKRIDPGVRIELLVRGGLPDGMAEPGLLDALHEVSADDDWEDTIRRLAPRLTVWDTTPPRRSIVARNGCRHALVMRNVRHATRRRLLTPASLSRFDRIVVPHDPDELGAELDPELAGRCALVGPIVRVPRPEATAELRDRYTLGPDEFVLVSTAGGGGFADHAALLFDALRLAQPDLAARIGNLRHLLVLGPRYAGPPPRVPGIEAVTSEPDLVGLFALASCVVAACGYNTVNELRGTRAPAVLLPGRRTHDDQLERARWMSARGMAAVAAGTADACARTIVATCGDPPTLHRMRLAHDRHPLDAGNDRAALALLELLRC